MVMGRAKIRVVVPTCVDKSKDEKEKNISLLTNTSDSSYSSIILFYSRTPS